MTNERDQEREPMWPRRCSVWLPSDGNVPEAVQARRDKPVLVDLMGPEEDMAQGGVDALVRTNVKVRDLSRGHPVLGTDTAEAVRRHAQKE